MNIALTGATGFVGRRVAGYLSRRSDIQIIAMVRGGSNTESLRAATGEKVKIVRIDPDVEVITRALRDARVEVVVHIASMFRAAHKAVEVAELVRSNIEFPITLVEAMIQCGVRRLVATGTTWQHYGNNVYDPVNLYAATKEGFGSVCRYYERARGLRSLVLELSDTYGPDDRRGKIIDVLLAAQRDGRKLEMSGGEQMLDLVHVDDVARAFEIAIDRIGKQEAERNEYAVGSDAPVRLRDLVLAFEEARGCHLDVTWGRVPYRERELFHSVRVHERLPGWKPQIALREGLASLPL